MTLSRVEHETTEPDHHTRHRIESWLKAGKNKTPPARYSYSPWIEDAERRISKLESEVFKGKKEP